VLDRRDTPDAIFAKKPNSEPVPPRIMHVGIVLSIFGKVIIVIVGIV